MADNHIDLGIEGLVDSVEVGIGGFATVYRSHQPAFRRTVAVKVLATRNLDDAARERFERECQAMGALSEHPNIVTVYGAGFSRAGSPYLVMAYLPGGSLQEHLDQRGPIPWQDATLYGVHLAGALETAHRAGIVHRDIKPGNVLTSAYGDAQLTDFGIARISGGHETRSGVITASMAHASPEVLDGHRPTVSADVYSLGSTLYELLAGTAAFASDQDESMVPMLRRILTSPPPDLRPRGVPDAVCRVIERAMAKDPRQRHSSAVELGRELQQARRSLGLDPGRLTVPAEAEIAERVTQAPIAFVAAPITPGAPAAAGPVTPGGRASYPPPQTPSPYARPSDPPSSVVPELPPPAKRSPAVLIGIAALVVVVILGALTVVLLRRPGPTDVATTTTTTLDGTTTTTDEGGNETTTTLSSRGYTAAIETNFVNRCADNEGNSRTFCRCVFQEIKAKIAFDRFVAINDDPDVAIEDTEIGPIIQDCQRRNPGTPGTTEG